MASAKGTSKSAGFWTSRLLQRRALSAAKAGFVLCIDAGDHVDLDLRKVYRVKPDKDAAKHGLLRVVDESGEDYLYPAERFVPVQLPKDALRIVADLD